MIQSLKKKFVGIPVDFSFAPISGGVFSHALIQMSADPTSAGVIDIYVHNGSDPDFRVEIEQRNPRRGALRASQFYEPNTPIPLVPGESVQVVYANPDNLTVAVTLKGDDRAKLAKL